MQVGFTATLRRNSVAFTTHGAPGPLISSAQNARASVCFIGRLYYHEDRIAGLRDRLSTDERRLLSANDAALVLALFDARGVRALEELEGDYALLLWDHANHRLHGSRDPMGGYPLFWCARPAGVAVGTSLGPLLNFLGQRVINRAFIAEYLTILGQQNEGQSEECVYAGVRRVLPGSILTCDVGTLHAQQRRYWNWMERMVDPETDNLVEAAAGYGDRLRRAVAERYRGATLAHLSGGMDSTGVAVLAQREFAAGRVTDPLYTASVVYHGLPKLARERPFIEGVLATMDPAHVHRIAGDDLLDYDAYHDSPPHDEPYPGLWRLQMDRALVDLADQVGATTILTGIGADEICAVQPYHLADLLRSGRILKAWTEAGRWAKAYNCSKWELLRQFAFNPLGWTWLAHRPTAATGLLGQTDVSVPPWINGAFAREFCLSTRLRERPRDIQGRVGSALVSITVHGLCAEAGDPVRWMCAAPRHLAIAHPFLDPRVLSFGLGVQRRVTIEPGKMKPLLVEALRDVLPPLILQRRAKGHFDEVYYLGLARNLARLEKMVRAAPLDDLGVFDGNLLANLLEEASLAGPDSRQLQRLDHTLAFIKWYSHQKTWCRSMGQQVHTEISATASALPAERNQSGIQWKTT